MNAKEFLNQAYRTEKNIRCISKEIQLMKELAVKTGVKLSDMPRVPNRNIGRIEDAVVRLADLEEDLVENLRKLPEQRSVIMHAIGKLEDAKLRILLEERYLFYQPWSRIAEELKLSTQHAYRLHSQALKEIENILKLRVDESQ